MHFDNNVIEGLARKHPVYGVVNGSTIRETKHEILTVLVDRKAKILKRVRPVHCERGSIGPNYPVIRLDKDHTFGQPAYNLLQLRRLGWMASGTFLFSLLHSGAPFCNRALNHARA
jgi:hypothetical protein